MLESRADHVEDRKLIRTCNRLKLKRPQTAKAFRPQIDAMYAEINAAPSAKAKL